jgi:copper(I)-binding protein
VTTDVRTINMQKTPAPVWAAVAAAGVLALTGCAAETGGAPATSAPTTASTAAVVVKDPWVKAAGSGMTAAFGILVNDTAADVTVVSATSPASPLEIHEMAMKDGAMVMQRKAGGLVIKARSTHELKPGGDHLMLMSPKAPVKPGDELTFTLTLSDGSSVPFTAVAKPFAGAGESYDPSTGHGAPMSGMPTTAP